MKYQKIGKIIAGLLAILIVFGRLSMGAEASVKEQPPFEEFNLTIMAVGDNLMHMGVVNTGKQEDGSLDYSCLYDGIAPFMANSDIKIINQETILGGNERGFSGFPQFNSPIEVGESQARVGFNVVLQASNHTADQGVSGMDYCTAFWKTHPEAHMIGLHDPSEENPYTVLDIKGVKVAVLNYTYGPNYEVVSKEVALRMNLLCNRNEKTGQMDYTTLNPQVPEDIKRAKAEADIVVVCPHWGTEYQTSPSSYQRNFAQQMTDAGADVIIGTHPHVVQPVEEIVSENGHRCLCYYSLGNYVSTQKNRDSMLEGLAFITFHVSKEGISIVPSQTGVIPLVCQYRSGPTRIMYVYPLEDYTEELAKQHGIIPSGGVSFHLSDMQNLSEKVFGTYVLPKDIALKVPRTS